MLLKRFLLVAAMVTSINIFAKEVKSVDGAIDLIKRSIVKNKLTDIKPECLVFMYGDDKDKPFYSIDVREKHDDGKKCGGDSKVMPRLFTYKVNKRTGEMLTDAPIETEHGFVWLDEYRKVY